MAFMFARNFPFENGPCFAQASGPGSCHASAQAFAGPGGGRCFRGRNRAGPGFAFGDVSSFQSDLVDTPEAYLIYFDATGFEREDVHVKVVERTLKLSAKKGQAVALERAWGLPEDVLEDDITAKFSNHELTITLPRIPQEPKASFDVPIETGTNATAPSTSPAGPEPVPEAAEAPMDPEANDQDVDGSWVEVADEDVTRAKEKDKASDDGLVLEKADK